MNKQAVPKQKISLLHRILRLVVIAIAAWMTFRFLFRPMFLSGASMLPTFPAQGFLFCWAPAYLFSGPDRGDVCVFAFGGERVLLLKRVVALEGDTVEIRNGMLYVNGVMQEEPYVKYRSEMWNLAPRQVAAGKLFILGDNRDMPLSAHTGGQIDRKRLRGKPIWW